MRYIATINDQEYVVEIVDEGRVRINDQEYQIDFHPVSNQPVYSMLVDGKSYEAYVYPLEETWQVLLRGRQFSIQVEDEREKRLRAASGGQVFGGVEFQLKSPMPGLIVAIPVSEGQHVTKGELLLILESMKMQNELKSPRDGIVSRIRVKPGESVEQRQTLLTVH